MSQIHVRQPHAVGRTDARSKLESFEAMLQKYKVKLNWKGDSAAIKGVGVSGGIDILDDAVDVKVKLGMLAKAAGVDAGRLESSISKRLKAAFED